jgi:hypothetical protein
VQPVDLREEGGSHSHSSEVTAGMATGARMLWRPRWGLPRSPSALGRPRTDPSDIDVAMIYKNSTPVVLMQLAAKLSR